MTSSRGVDELEQVRLAARATPGQWAFACFQLVESASARWLADGTPEHRADLDLALETYARALAAVVSWPVGRHDPGLRERVMAFGAESR